MQLIKAKIKVAYGLSNKKEREAIESVTNAYGIKAIPKIVK